MHLFRTVDEGDAWNGDEGMDDFDWKGSTETHESNKWKNLWIPWKSALWVASVEIVASVEKRKQQQQKPCISKCTWLLRSRAGAMRPAKRLLLCMHLCWLAIMRDADSRANAELCPITLRNPWTKRAISFAFMDYLLICYTGYLAPSKFNCNFRVRLRDLANVLACNHEENNGIK